MTKVFKNNSSLNKNARVLACILVVALSGMFITGCGADEEFLNEKLAEPIAISGDFEYYLSLDEEERTEMCEGKHIEVTGIVSRESDSVPYIGDEDEDGFYISCSFPSSKDELEDVKEGDLITLHGVCTSSFEHVMYVEGCELTKHTKENDINMPVKAPFDSKSCENKSEDEIYTAFKNAGFKDITYTEHEYPYGNGTYKDGDIIKVTVNGNVITDINTKYYEKDEVEIHYATVPFAKEVVFGSYEQNNMNDGKEGISWYVLTTEGNKSLLISKYILDYQAFNDTTLAEGTDWKNSTLRGWLNNNFYNVAFSDHEKSHINTALVQDYKPDDKLGEQTNDNVFVLSYAEVTKYISEDDRDADLTRYASAQNKYSHSSWWLIDSDASDLYKYVINSYGNHDNSPRVNEPQGVRPAIWVDNGALY